MVSTSLKAGSASVASIDSNASNAHLPAMATLTIRNFPDAVRDRLRVRAAENSRSMEAEAREILAEAVRTEERRAWPSAAERVARAQKLFAPHRPAGVSLVEELLKERRKAAARGD